MTRYVERVCARLSEVLASRSEHRSDELSDLRLVVFSDHHRGQGDGADDFRHSKPVYHAALGYYLELGHELLLLGDVEELWENPPHEIVAQHADTLALEQRFGAAGGSLRFWGNHDDLWASPAAVRHYLYPSSERTEVPPVVEALTLEVTDAGRPIGTLFFTHGHQGSGPSDRFAAVSRWLLRWFWRPLQRLLHLHITTPAGDYALRKKHELALHEWASRASRLVLVTGHTHHPVFSSESHGQLLRTELEELRRRHAEAATPEAADRLRHSLARHAAELEWVVARAHGEGMAIPSGGKPCYFNAGCCSYSDGAITGIEIADGEIRLVRWSDRGGSPERRVLRKARLRRVLARCE